PFVYYNFPAMAITNVVGGPGLQQQQAAIQQQEQLKAKQDAEAEAARQKALRAANAKTAANNLHKYQGKPAKGVQNFTAQVKSALGSAVPQFLAMQKHPPRTLKPADEGIANLDKVLQFVSQNAEDP